VKRGVLIVFEGVDGSGKSTQLPRLAARLRAAGHRVVETGEPYDCPAGRRIREMARRGEVTAPEQERDLFFEQRREHVRRVIRPALVSGEVVLSDRYFLSTVAYQGARGLDAGKLLAESEAEFPAPDLVLLLELPPASGLERVARRGGTPEPAFEHAGFLAQVAERFHALDRPYIERIDAGGEPEAVEQRIARAVAMRLGLLEPLD
jgi:dTMP kinase